MALNTQELADFLKDKPNLLRNALGQTQFKGQQIDMANLATWLDAHPNAAQRMAKHVQQARPEKAPSFGLTDSAGSGAKKRDPLRAYNNPSVSNLSGKNQKQGVRDSLIASGLESEINRQEQYQQKGPFGGSQTVTKDEQGNVTVDKQLGEGAKSISTLDDQISEGGRKLAKGYMDSGQFNQMYNPQLADRQFSGDLVGDRARIEKEMFQRLTRDLDTEYDLEKGKLEAVLHSKGVPLTPESEQYRRTMEELNKRYDRRRAEARQDAVSMGGDEYQRSFGIGETLRGNQLQEQSNIRTQQLGELSAFANMGPGVRVDQFTPYDPYKPDLPDPTALDAAKRGVGQADRNLDIQQQNVNLNAEQLALQREQLELQKQQDEENAAFPEGGGPVEGGEEPPAGRPPPGTRARMAPTQPPAWQAGQDRNTLLKQRARIQNRLNTGTAASTAEAQRRLKLVNQGLRAQG